MKSRFGAEIIRLEERKMSDLEEYVIERKKRDKKFEEGYDEGYERLKRWNVVFCALVYNHLTKRGRTRGDGRRIR